MTTETNLSKLQKLQNGGMRKILKCHPHTHVCDMLKVLKWLNIRQRILFANYILIFKIVNRKTPEYLSDIFTSSSDIQHYNTRTSISNRLYVQLGHKHSLRNYGHSLWNSLPPEIKTKTSLVRLLGMSRDQNELSVESNRSDTKVCISEC